MLHGRGGGMMNSPAAKTLAVVLAAAATGCSGEIHRVSTLSPGQVLSIDARQRLVLVGERNGQTIYCAEPSPDAIVARASYAAAQANATTPQGTNAGGGVGVATNEAVGSIGLRTQTIQLLRDGYYRVCEAYLNGAIDDKEYKDILDVIDIFMLALVSLESLSGTVAAPAIAIGTNGRLTLNSGDKSIEGEVTSRDALIEAVTAKTGTLQKHQAEAITRIVLDYFWLRRKMIEAKHKKRSNFS